MAYRPSDSSGTDDDLPPPHMNQITRGGVRPVGNGISSVGKILNVQSQTDMEARIRRIEEEAYCAVLRAFIAQSDAVSWEKEELISELRKELRVSDTDHRDLLGKVDKDDVLRHIRECRQAASNQHNFMSATARSSVKTFDPTFSASFKKQKTTPVVASLPQAVVPSSAHTTSAKLTSSAVGRGGAVGGVGGRKSKGMHMKDIRWNCDGPLETSRGQAGHSKKIMADHGGKGLAFPKGQSTGYASFQNGIGRKKPETIELRQTDKLIKEVERLCRDNPDPSVVENAKMALDEQEQCLEEAIRRLEASEEEDLQMPHSSRTHANQERMWRNRQVNLNGACNKENIAGGSRGERSNRNRMVGEGGVTSDEQQDDDFDEDG